jgi:hypothetical protein
MSMDEAHDNAIVDSHFGDSDCIEFKTPQDAQKALKLYMEMSNKIVELEGRIERIEGFLVL